MRSAFNFAQAFGHRRTTQTPCPGSVGIPYPSGHPLMKVYQKIATARQHALYTERGIVLPIPSVRPSVCLSNAGIVSKRMDISTLFFTFE